MRKTMAAVFVLVLAGCDGGGSPDNLEVSVVNLEAHTATFAWQTGGLLGTRLLPSTGTDSIDGCGRYKRTFGAGHTEVTITTATHKMTIPFDAGRDDQQTHYFQIASDGAISETDEGSVPSIGCGSYN
jgi:hypothetical protein